MGRASMQAWLVCMLVLGACSGRPEKASIPAAGSTDSLPGLGRSRLLLSVAGHAAAGPSGVSDFRGLRRSVTGT
jgi:hypothetical protein